MAARDLTFAEIGNDVSTLADGDLDLTFAPITGSRVVAEGVMRRWFSVRGRVFWARNMGRNAGAMVNADMSKLEMERGKIALAQEALSVDGCRACRVSFVRDEETGHLDIKADIDTTAGKTELNVSVGNAGQIIGAQIRARNGS